MGAAGSPLHHIPVVLFPPLSVWTQAHVCWYAPSVSQLCRLSFKKGPDERSSIPPPTAVTSSIPSPSWQHGWPLSPCQHPGIMWPVTKAHSTSGGTLQLAAPWWEPIARKESFFFFFFDQLYRFLSEMCYNWGQWSFASGANSNAKLLINTEQKQLL